MKNIIKIIFLFVLTLTVCKITLANTTSSAPTSNPNFQVAVSGGNAAGSEIDIKLTNSSQSQIDLQNSQIVFITPDSVTSVWGDFSPAVSWPDHMNFTSTALNNQYNNQVNLVFEKKQWQANSNLAPGASIILKFNQNEALNNAEIQALQSSVKVFTSVTPPLNLGQINLIAPAAPGDDVIKQQPSATITCENQSSQKINLPGWQQQKIANNLPLGLCIVHTNPVGSYPSGADQTVDLNKAQNHEATVTLKYGQAVITATLNITLQKPNGADNQLPNQTATLIDNNDTFQAIPTVWNMPSTVKTLIDGTNYSVWAPSFTFQGNHYISPYPSSKQAYQFTANHKKPTTVTLLYTKKALPTYAVTVNLQGLPSTASGINVKFMGTDTSQYSFTMNEGSNSVKLPAGIYNVTAAPYKDSHGKNYYASPLSNIAVPNNNPITISYSSSTSKVPGWPSYLAMGTITLTEATTTPAMANAKVDSIFKYAGDGGNGDPGKIWPLDTEQNQSWTGKTVRQARNIESLSSKKVMPVMVVYTIDMSGGTSFDDVTNDLYLRDHYINLIHTLVDMEKFKDAQHPNPGTVILNPDFIGQLQSSNTDPTTINVNVNAQLTNAANYVKQEGINIGPFPQFANNLIGYIQSINYLSRIVGPDVSFGWQENVWGGGGASWITKSPNEASTKGINDGNYILQLGVYTGQYKPDFIVLDRYEHDDFSQTAIDEAAAYKGITWQAYLTFVKAVSSTLNVPAMIWQIPGGHMVSTQETLGLDTNWIDAHSSSGGDFFFGDTTIANNLANIDSRVLSIPISAYAANSYYNGATSVSSLLEQDKSFNWSQNHLQDTINSNVFAILWGGGETTAVVPIGGGSNGDDKGWLANKVKAYMQDPLPLK